MMEYEINSGVSKTELSVKLAGVTQFDEFRYRMVRENSISGIVTPVRSQENDLTVYTYDITGMQPVAKRFVGKKFNLQEIKKLYTQIINTLVKSEEYFLDKNCFLLSEDLILYEEESKTYQLAYCPEARQEMKSQFADFTEYVVNHTEYSDKAAVALIYEVFRMMREEHTTIHEVLTYITEGRRQSKVEAKGMEQQNVMPMGNMVAPESFVPKMTPPQAQGTVTNQSSLAKNPFEGESEKKEKNGFSVKKLLICTATVIAGIGGFLAVYLSGVLCIARTRKLDTSKFAGAALIIGAVVFYICYKVLEKKEEDKPNEAKEKAKEKRKNKKEDKKPAAASPVVPVSQAQPVPPVQPMYEAQPVQQMKPMAPVQSIRREPIMEVERKGVYRLVAGQEMNAQQFVLNKSPYVLGKSYEQVDGVIYSDAVSKVHAEFVEDRGNLYVIDMSSTNGTYVNKRKIASNERVRVGEGDRIQIADKEYLLCS